MYIFLLLHVCIWSSCRTYEWRFYEDPLDWRYAIDSPSHTICCHAIVFCTSIAKQQHQHESIWPNIDYGFNLVINSTALANFSNPRKIIMMMRRTKPGATLSEPGVGQQQRCRSYKTLCTVVLEQKKSFKSRIERISGHLQFVICYGTHTAEQEKVIVLQSVSKL